MRGRHGAAYSRSPGRRSIPALDVGWACGRPKGGIVAAGHPCGDLPWLAALALFGPVQRLTAQSDWAALLQTAKSRKTPHDLWSCAWWCGCTMDNRVPSPGVLGTAGSECVFYSRVDCLCSCPAWLSQAASSARRLHMYKLSTMLYDYIHTIIRCRNSFQRPAQASHKPSPPAPGR